MFATATPSKTAASAPDTTRAARQRAYGALIAYARDEWRGTARVFRCTDDVTNANGRRHHDTTRRRQQGLPSTARAPSPMRCLDLRDDVTAMRRHLHPRLGCERFAVTRRTDSEPPTPSPSLRARPIRTTRSAGPRGAATRARDRGPGCRRANTAEFAPTCRSTA